MVRTKYAGCGAIGGRWQRAMIAMAAAVAVALSQTGQAHARSAPAAARSSSADASTAAEPAPSSEPFSVSMYLLVQVDLGESDAEVEPVVRQRVRERLHALGLREERGAVRELTVTVRWADADAGGSESYAVDYAFATLTDGTPKLLASEVCDRCGMGELLAMLDRDIAELRPQLVVPVGVPAPTVATTPSSADAAPPSKRRRVPLATLGKVGVGVTVAGALGVVAGGALLGVPTRERVAPDNSQYLERTSYRTPGIAVLAVGAGVLVAGVAMLVVDRVHARRVRR